MTARSRSKSIARSLVGGFAVAATVVTCAAEAGQAPRPNAGAARTPATPPAAVAAAPGVTVPSEYVIGADDVLSIVFWRDKELSSDVTVRPDGNVSIPLINDVHAAGLTPAQLKDRIVDESKKYVEDPNVTVVVKTINSRKVFITGEVKKPGAYPLTEPTTVLQLISVSGGLGDYAKSEKILVVRMNNGKPMSYRFNYKEVINQQKLTQNIELKPGDTVIVP
jgi:polysaccharide export outer membrane protein